MEKRLDIGTYPARTMPFAWNAGIINTKEKWELLIRTLNGSDELLEEAILNITFPNGKTWEGTMQDLMAVFTILQNTLELMETAMTDYEEKFTSMNEITHILSHLKSKNVCLEDQQKP